MDSLFDWHLIATVLCETEKLCQVRRKAMGFAPNGATEIMRIILQGGKGLVNWVFVQNTLTLPLSAPLPVYSNGPIQEENLSGCIFPKLFSVSVFMQSSPCKRHLRSELCKLIFEVISRE